MTQNIFIKCIDGIVKEAYDGGDKVKYDWQTAIDRFDATHHITAAIADKTEVARQRSEFLTYVKNRKFAPDGTEIKARPELSDKYMVDGEEVRITGDMAD